MPKVLDLDIFSKIGLERKPICIKFSYLEPKDLKKSDKEMSLCEFISEAQRLDISHMKRFMGLIYIFLEHS